LKKRGLGLYIVTAGAGERDIDDLSDPAGPRRHHNDPVGQIQGFFD